MRTKQDQFYRQAASHLPLHLAGGAIVIETQKPSNAAVHKKDPTIPDMGAGHWWINEKGRVQKGSSHAYHDFMVQSLRNKN